MKRVKIDLLARCECGVTSEIEDIGGDFRITPPQFDESGTSWPGEIEIRCPACGGTDDTRTC